MATHSSILVLGNPMDREAWRATGHRVTKEWDTMQQLNHHHQVLIKFFFFNFLLYTGVQLMNNVLTVSGVQQTDTVYMYTHLFFFKFFSHLGCYITLSRVPYAIQQVLIGDLFIFGCATWHVETQFPDQGLNSQPPQWKRSLNHWTTKDVLGYLF